MWGSLVVIFHVADEAALDEEFEQTTAASLRWKAARDPAVPPQRLRQEDRVLFAISFELEQVVDCNRDRLHGDDYGETPVIRRNHFYGSRTAVRNRVQGNP